MRLGPEVVDLRLTLIDSAQCFRWISHRGGFGAVFSGRPVWLFEDAAGVRMEGGDRRFFRNYLDLDRDYSLLRSKYSVFPIAQAALEGLPGLRRLNQPAWETLISFILSANNNVSRIRSLVLKLSETLGEPFETRGTVLYAFPTPEVLASADEAVLRDLGVGYRAPFLIKTARAVADGFSLAALRKMDYEAAHASLISLAGVGDKVADCVQLLGCGHSCAFPVDVWVERLMRQWFDTTASSRKSLAAIAREKFGEEGGILQMFLFHAARVGLIDSPDGKAIG